jgi:hypothetical protein
VYSYIIRNATIFKKRVSLKNTDKRDKCKILAAYLLEHARYQVSYSTLLDATRRYSTLLNATRRYLTLLDATIARSGTVVAPEGAAARNGQCHCCFFSLKPASTVFFFSRQKNIQISYMALKKIVGISQYAYFSSISYMSDHERARYEARALLAALVT